MEVVNIDVILISGKSGSGKDYYARCINYKLSKLGYKTKITHFADYLKYILTKYMDWDGIKDENGRNLLIYVGNKKRSDDKYFWARHLADEIEISKDKYDFFVVADLRYISEAEEMCKRFRCKKIRINGEYKSDLTEKQKSDISECELDGISEFFDYFINSEEDINNFLEVYYGKH